MQIPIFTDCFNALETNIKPLLENQAVEFRGNIGRENFISILSKLINENINSQFTAEEIKGLISLSDQLHGVDCDTILKTSIRESAELLKKIKQDFDMAKAPDYITSAILEALKSFQLNISDDFIKVAEGEKTVLLSHDAENMEIKADKTTTHSGNPKDLSNNGISKDIQQLIEKSFFELRSTAQSNLNSKGWTETIVTGTVTSPNAKLEGVANTSSADTNGRISDAKTINGLADRIQTSFKHDIRASLDPLNKDSSNIPSINNNSTFVENEIHTTISTKTSFDTLKDHSEHSETNSQNQNGNSAVTENNTTSSSQPFSSFINKSALQGNSLRAQQTARLDYPALGTQKVMILNSDEKSLKLTIDPDGIGTLDIELTLEKGVINAQILASDSVGKNFLDNNISILLNSLMREGLNIGKFSIYLGNNRDNTKENHGESAQPVKDSFHEPAISGSPNGHHLISIFV